MPLDKAEWIEEQMKTSIPDYNPGKVVESAKFLNEVKVCLDSKGPGIFKEFIESYSVTSGEPIKSGDTEEDIKEKLKSYDRKKGMENARKFLEGEPDLLERFDTLYSNACGLPAPKEA